MPTRSRLVESSYYRGSWCLSEQGEHGLCPSWRSSEHSTVCDRYDATWCQSDVSIDLIASHWERFDMLRCGKRVLIGLSGLLIIAVLTGATYQWIATRNDLSTTPPPGRLVDVGGHRLHIWCSGAGRLRSFLKLGWGDQALAGASFSLP